MWYLEVCGAQVCGAQVCDSLSSWHTHTFYLLSSRTFYLLRDTYRMYVCDTHSMSHTQNVCVWHTFYLTYVECMWQSTCHIHRTSVCGIPSISHTHNVCHELYVTSHIHGTCVCGIPSISYIVCMWYRTTFYLTYTQRMYVTYVLYHIHTMYVCHTHSMECLRLVGSFKLYVSFAKEPSNRRYSVKEKYNLKEPTSRSHPICHILWHSTCHIHRMYVCDIHSMSRTQNICDILLVTYLCTAYLHTTYLFIPAYTIHRRHHTRTFYLLSSWHHELITVHTVSLSRTAHRGVAIGCLRLVASIKL